MDDPRELAFCWCKIAGRFFRLGLKRRGRWARAPGPTLSTCPAGVSVHANGADCAIDSANDDGRPGVHPDAPRHVVQCRAVSIGARRAGNWNICLGRRHCSKVISSGKGTLLLTNDMYYFLYPKFTFSASSFSRPYSPRSKPGRPTSPLIEPAPENQDTLRGRVLVRLVDVSHILLCTLWTSHLRQCAVKVQIGNSLELLSDLSQRLSFKLGAGDVYRPRNPA